MAWVFDAKVLQQSLFIRLAIANHVALNTPIVFQASVTKVLDARPVVHFSKELTEQKNKMFLSWSIWARIRGMKVT